jgi:hypothetical protein
MMAFWGPEIRLMVFSGLIDRVVSEREVVLLSRVTDGGFVERLPKGCRLEPLVVDSMPQGLARLCSLANTAHGMRMDRLGMMRGLEGNVGVKSDHAGLQKLRRGLARLLKYSGGVRTMSAVEGLMRRKWASQIGPLQEQLKRIAPSAFLSMDTVHLSATLGAEVTKGLGGRSMLFAGSWKDISRGVRARSCWDYYLVWNRAMNENLLAQNPGLPRERVLEVGTPQFDLHSRMAQEKPRSEFMSELGLETERPLLCFTAASVRVVPEESKTVRGLCEAIADGRIGGSPALLVRLNPTGSDPGYRALPDDFPFVRVTEPKWDHRPELPGGRWQASEWEDTSQFANIILHSAMNISAASTVTLDFAVFDRPVVTIAYDPPESRAQGRSVATYPMQDVYRPAVELGACTIVRNEDDLCGAVNCYLEDSSRDSAGRNAFVEVSTGAHLCDSVEQLARVVLGRE